MSSDQRNFCQSFSGAAKSSGRLYQTATSLISMGVWCDLFRNQINEKTGEVKLARSKVARFYARSIATEL